MLQSLRPAPHKLIRSLLLPSLLLSTPFSTAAAASFSATSTTTVPLSFVPLVDPSIDLNAGEVAAAFKDWFRRGAAPLSPLDEIYAALSSYPDAPSLDAALSRLRLRLSEDLVLRALRHSPHASAAPDDLLLLRLKFFDWSGRQPGYRHTQAAYHAIFRLLSRARLVSVVLDWLHLFSSTRHESSHHSFLHRTGGAGSGSHPRFHDTLVVGYAVAGRPELALQLFARMRFQGLDLDSFSYHVLINALVEASLFDFADAVLTQIDTRGLASPVTACIKMKSLCCQSRLDEAEAYLRELMVSVCSERDRRAFTEHAVGTLVHALCKKGKFEEAGKLVEEFAAAGVYGIWVSNLVGARRLNTAMAFLQSKKVSGNYIAESSHYNKLISLLLSKNRLEEVYDMLVEMMKEGIPPDRLTMNTALCFFCKAGMVDVAIQLYHSRLEVGFSPNSLVFDHLINGLCRVGSIDEAYQVLEESMEQGYFPGKETFNILAGLLCREGKLDKVSKLLDVALQKKMKPITAVFARYISALCRAGNVEEACLVPYLVNEGKACLGRYKTTYTSLIHAFIVMRRADVLPRLIIEMQEQGHSPSRNLYREVLCCLCELDMFDAVLDLLYKQLELKEPDPRTCYNYFIEGAAHSKKPEMAREVYNRMVSAGIETNMDTDILLLQGYLKSRRIGDALNFFYHLIEKRQSSSKLYNIFISGLCEAGKLEQAVMFWREAREKGLIPSLQCYEELVLELCSSRNYDIVVKVLEDFKKTGRPVSSFLCNVLLLHTLKSQELLRAWVQLRDASGDAEFEDENKETLESGRLMLGQLIAAFSGGIRMKDNLDNLDEVVEKFFPVDGYTYNMLLRGLTMAGRMDSACNLFSRMRKKGYEPNRFSFDIIVHGFCKHGKRKDAERWMEDMYRNGFYPTWYTMRIYNHTP